MNPIAYSLIVRFLLRMDTSLSITMVYAEGMTRSRIESARALPPSRSCQPSGRNCEQRIVEDSPQRISMSSNRSLCSVSLVGISRGGSL